MPQMTIFECQKDKNMTRVKNKIINVNVPEILIPQLYKYVIWVGVNGLTLKLHRCVLQRCHLFLYM
jgi:hypothetical protein